MTTELDELIGAEVERTFAGEPPPREPREYVARGRRAQARRRVAGVVGVAGLTAVVGVLALGGSRPAGTPDRGIEPAGPSRGDVAPVPGTEPIPVDPFQAERCDAGKLGVCDGAISRDDLHYDAAGRLFRGYDSVRVDGYYTGVLSGSDSSAAVEIAVDDTTVWAIVTQHGLQTAPPDPSRTFDQWVQDGTADGSGGWFTYRPDPDGPGEGATPR